MWEIDSKDLLASRPKCMLIVTPPSYAFNMYTVTTTQNYSIRYLRLAYSLMADHYEQKVVRFWWCTIIDPIAWQSDPASSIQTGPHFVTVHCFRNYRVNTWIKGPSKSRIITSKSMTYNVFDNLDLSSLINPSQCTETAAGWDLINYTLQLLFRINIYSADSHQRHFIKFHEMIVTSMHWISNWSRYWILIVSRKQDGSSSFGFALSSLTTCSSNSLEIRARWYLIRSWIWILLAASRFWTQPYFFENTGLERKFRGDPHSTFNCRVYYSYGL